MKRTFIAQILPVTNELEDAIRFIQKNVTGLNVKWVEPHNLHLTLAFLGDTTHDQMNEVAQKLPDIVINFSEFNIRLTKAGAFKSLSNPQVVWIGIEADRMLEDLYHEVQNFAGELEFEKDLRPYKPHLTIGRIKSADPDHNLKEIILDEKAAVNQTVKATTIIYYESILQPAGPLYKPIQEYKLKKG